MIEAVDAESPRPPSPKPPFQRNTQSPTWINDPPTGASIPNTPGSEKPPNMKAKPTKKNATKPSPKIMKFVDTT